MLLFTKTASACLVTLLAIVQTASAEDLRRCFVDDFGYFWDFTEVDDEGFVWFQGTVELTDTDVRIASGISDPAGEGRWLFQSDAKDLSVPGFIYQLDPDPVCCSARGAWIDVFIVGDHGSVSVTERDCADSINASRERAVVGDPGERRPGRPTSLTRDNRRQGGDRVCFVDNFEAVWDLEGVATGGETRFFRGTLDNGRETRFAAGIGSLDRTRLALATEAGFGLPYAYEIDWNDPDQSGEGAWIWAYDVPFAAWGLVDFVETTRCRDSVSLWESPEK